MIKKFLLILFGILCITNATAQRRISGIVTDMNNEPLPGATVVVKELSTLGAVANVDGHYELRLPDNKDYTLMASFVGYIDVSKKVSDKQEDVLNFQLTENSITLDQVVVTGTRTPKLLKDVPIVTRVISDLDIKRMDATNISDLLQTELPGIEFSYSMNQQTSLNMSGFGGNSVLFLVDGERLAGETLDNVDYSRLNMDNVQRIEIVKGAASSLYGSNAVGGVVNIISRESQEPWSVNVNGRYGAHNEQRYGGSVGFNAGRFNSMTNVQYTSIDAIDLSNGTDNEEVGDYSMIYGNSTLNIKERLIYTPIDNLKFTARTGYFFRERNSSESQKERYRSFTGGLKGNYNITDKDDLEVAYSFDQYDKSDYLVFGDLDVRDYSNVQHILRALYNHTFADKHILTVGGDYMRDYLMSYQFTDGGSYIQHTADAFAQFDWNPHKKFNLIAGLRFDYFSEAKLSHLSPKLGLMYKLGNCSLRGSYAGGFRAPTLKEMYMNFYMGNIFMIYGNPDLKPESSHNLSLSAEYMKGNHNLTVTGFYNIVDNRITTAWNQALGGQVYTNMSRLQVMGVDANASGKYRCGISWRLSYAYTYEHIKKGEPMLSATRPHTATARIAYDKDWNNYGLSVALTGRYLSKLTTDVYTEMTSYEQTEKQTYPGYTIWKLSFAQRVRNGINITLVVDNLFNYRPDYYYSNSPSTTGTTFSVGLSLDIEQMSKK
ncbi:MAG: TonB-dependent receptor [Bacteroidales bacterium]|nr:TonB-dependent receptor [Bacteroidales bacterium]